MSILIVEDNPINAKLIEFALKAKGYHTLSAVNGAEALRTLSEQDDVELIITDYMMPEMNGLEFITTVKRQPEWESIPIIVASAYSNLETVKQAMELGCTDFLVKPIDKTQLLERVAHVLKDAPVVLQDKRHVMQTLDIGAVEYEDLARMFATQLYVALPLVVLEQQESDEPVSENLSRLLKELAESAAILGGERFVRRYSSYKAGNTLTRSKCSALLRSLQELETVLTATGYPSPGTVSNS